VSENVKEDIVEKDIFSAIYFYRMIILWLKGVK